MSEENKKKYKSKSKKSIITSEFSLSQLLVSICFSIFILVVFHWFNIVDNPIPFLPSIKKLGVEESMTGYIAVLGAIPTVYLWVVKERKKEQELKNKKQELNQVKISELNKVYVDAVNQFSKHETVLAGAYALNGLIDDWIGMAKEYPENRFYYNTRVEQILGIILTLNRKELQENAQEQYNTLLVSLIKRLSHKSYSTPIRWKDFDISMIDASETNFEGANLEGANLEGANFTESNLIDSTFECADLKKVEFIVSELKGSNLTKANLTKANLHGANLENADLTMANLRGANLKGISLKKAELLNANLEETDLTMADLRGANLIMANLVGADLTMADLRGANLEKADLRGANLKGAFYDACDLRGANLEEANLEELDYSEFFS